MIKLDINAPILPHESIWSIKLNTHIKELWDIINTYKNVEMIMMNNFKWCCKIDDTICLIFNLMNWKIFAIIAKSNYKWKLFWDISVWMIIEKALQIEPSLIYDDFEELYVSNKWIVIEVIWTKINWIQIQTKERELSSLEIGWEFDKGEW